MIVFSEPCQVATVDILGTYFKKSVCVSDQERATTISKVRASFGCVKIEGVKHITGIK
jgi:hypothetical protein